MAASPLPICTCRRGVLWAPDVSFNIELEYPKGKSYDTPLKVVVSDIGPVLLLDLVRGAHKTCIGNILCSKTALICLTLALGWATRETAHPAFLSAVGNAGDVG